MINIDPVNKQNKNKIWKKYKILIPKNNFVGGLPYRALQVYYWNNIEYDVNSTNHKKDLLAVTLDNDFMTDNDVNNF